MPEAPCNLISESRLNAVNLAVVKAAGVCIVYETTSKNIVMTGSNARANGLFYLTTALSPPVGIPTAFNSLLQREETTQSVDTSRALEDDLPDLVTSSDDDDDSSSDTVKVRRIPVLNANSKQPIAPKSKQRQNIEVQKFTILPLEQKSTAFVKY